MPKRHEARQRLREQREERKAEGKPRQSGPLVLMAEETLEVLRRGGYNSSQDGRWVDLSAELRGSIEGSSFHPAEERLPAARDAPPAPRVAFERATAFGAARDRALGAAAGEPRLRTCVLNFASAKHPGGGWRSGAVAQEEALARASGLYPTLTRHMGMYGSSPAGLYSDRMIYSPGVPVFRDDESGALLHEPFLCDVVSAAACNVKGLKGKDKQRLEETMRRRVQRVLRLAHAKGANCLVLGAWGTGVFGLDPYDVAEWFREGLREVHFDEVVFAIPDARKLAIFEEVFSEETDGEGEQDSEQTPCTDALQPAPAP